MMTPLKLISPGENDTKILAESGRNLHTFVLNRTASERSREDTVTDSVKEDLSPPPAILVNRSFRRLTFAAFKRRIMSMPARPSVRRWNPVLGEWVIVAPATAERPWNGALVPAAASDLPEYDPGCYLCPGVARAGGKVNPPYTGVHVFDNDFPSLSPEYTAVCGEGYSGCDIPAYGICRVVCFSPKHNVTLPVMSEEEVYHVMIAFRDQFAELSSTPGIEHVMLFENRGKIIGVSNPHPHGQIYATGFVPRIPAARYENARRYRLDTGKCLLCAVIENESREGKRIIAQNDDFIAFVPYFARLAYEVMLLPRRHVAVITGLSDRELRSLAAIYREIMIRYDNLFLMPFPNITVFQNCPCAPGIDPEPYHFHIEFLPPLRSRDKLKYMAGFESGGGVIVNPALPDESAEALCRADVIHYTEKMTKT
jgi:UDPglucose--hexose-1-phosphate uridylyltransferase